MLHWNIDPLILRLIKSERVDRELSGWLWLKSPLFRDRASLYKELQGVSPRLGGEEAGMAFSPCFNQRGVRGVSDVRSTVQWGCCSGVWVGSHWPEVPGWISRLFNSKSTSGAWSGDLWQRGQTKDLKYSPFQGLLLQDKVLQDPFFHSRPNVSHFGADLFDGKTI